MAVTRLERKARRNKSRAKVRVKNLHRVQSRVYVESPNKGESGVILDIEDPFATLNEKAAPKKTKAKAKAEPKAEVEAPATEEVVEAVAEEAAEVVAEEAAEVEAPEADTAEA